MKRECYEQFFSWRSAVLKSDLQPTTRHVLLTLSCHMNDAGESCYPTIETLVLETGLSRPAVIKHLKIAKDLGWIRIDKHGFSGQRWSRNDYQISWPSVNEGGQPRLPPSACEAVKAVNVVAEGSKRGSGKAVNQVNPSTPVNSPRVLQTPTPSAAPDENGDDPFNTTPPFITLPLNTGAEYPIHEPQIAEWGTLFPAVDVRQELRAMRAWLLADPKRRKTRNGVLRFVTSWLSRTQDRGGNGHATRQQDPRSRAQRVSDKLDDIARQDANRRGIPNHVG